MGVVEVANGLDLHNDVVVANEVGTVGLLELVPVVVDLELFLSLEGYAALSELNGQGFLVDCFEEPGAEGVVNVHRGSRDVIGLLAAVDHDA